MGLVYNSVFLVSVFLNDAVQCTFTPFVIAEIVQCTKNTGCDIVLYSVRAVDAQKGCIGLANCATKARVRSDPLSRSRNSKQFRCCSKSHPGKQCALWVGGRGRGWGDDEGRRGEFVTGNGFGDWSGGC